MKFKSITINENGKRKTYTDYYLIGSIEDNTITETDSYGNTIGMDNPNRGSVFSQKAFENNVNQKTDASYWFANTVNGTDKDGILYVIAKNILEYKIY